MQFASLTSMLGCSTTQSLDGLSTILYRHSSVLLRFKFFIEWEEHFGYNCLFQFTYSDQVNSLPWTSCDNPWNSNSSCVILSDVQVKESFHIIVE